MFKFISNSWYYFKVCSYSLTINRNKERVRKTWKLSLTSKRLLCIFSDFYQPEDYGTTHMGVVAPNGDAVAITSTINQL